mmetsp:Transcript_54635/g.160688  ORF Transcript_54635/g.160688 Transcript_54635/m.160688 type:complete len:478 (-) Transcript_54635:80-1513(-)
MRRDGEATPLQDLHRLGAVLEPGVLVRGLLRVPELADGAQGGQHLVRVGHAAPVRPPGVASLERAGLDGEGEEGLHGLPAPAEVLLELVQREVLAELRDVVEHHQLLLLPVRQDRLGQPGDGAEHRGHVADVEAEDAADVVVAHDLVHLAQRAQRHLRQRQALEVHDHREVLHLAGDHHVAEEVLHAEDQDPDELVDPLLLVPLLRDPVGPDHHDGPQGVVAPAEVDDAVAHVLQDGVVGHRAVLEVVVPPVLRRLHELQRLLGVHPGPAEEARGHRDHRRAELHALRPLRPGLAAQHRQALQLRLRQREMAVDLPLRVAVGPGRDDSVGVRHVAERLLRERERGDVLLPAGEGGRLAQALEAVVHLALHQPGRHGVTLVVLAVRGGPGGALRRGLAIVKMPVAVGAGQGSRVGLVLLGLIARGRLLRPLIDGQSCLVRLQQDRRETPVGVALRGAGRLPGRGGRGPCGDAARAAHL